MQSKFDAKRAKRATAQFEQESRAAARKPRNAEAILFGLMFANQTDLTK